MFLYREDRKYNRNHKTECLSKLCSLLNFIIEHDTFPLQNLLHMQLYYLISVLKRESRINFLTFEIATMERTRELLALALLAEEQSLVPSSVQCPFHGAHSHVDTMVSILCTNAHMPLIILGSVNQKINTSHYEDVTASHLHTCNIILKIRS